MFRFLEMAGNYKDRQLARYGDGTLIISTTVVNDAAQPYETGILHPNYRGGKWVTVEAYDDKEQALVGHDKWVEVMKNPPDELIDCANSELQSSLLGKQTFKRIKS